VPGNSGGESEEIIGRWLKQRPGVRERIVIFTKVGSRTGGPNPGGLSKDGIVHGAERSLARLSVDSIDLYFSHWPDPATPLDETLAAFAKLKEQGKIRAIGASNVDASQLEEAMTTAEKESLPSYQAVQTEYNLYNRDGFEGQLREICLKQQLGVVTYYSLAAGFLTGKYRSADDLSQSQRGTRVAKYLDTRGFAIVDALDKVANARGAKPAEIALAWLMAQEGVSAPIASATDISHVQSFRRAADIHLTPDELNLLNVK
jgi:aryl-alcohol dehydrogenase-like predicted oxidoreductase